MGFWTWLEGRDRRNQEFMDAIGGRARPHGTGVIIESRPGDPNADVDSWPNRVRVDGGKRRRLLWGTTFHALEPGVHTLEFDNEAPLGRWTTRAQVEVQVPADGHVRLRFRPPFRMGQRPMLEILARDPDGEPSSA